MAARPRRPRPQHDAAYRRLTVHLRQMRKAAGKTQRELALDLRIHHTVLHRCETGDRRIDPIEFARWCRACGFKAGTELDRVVYP